jgi:hypothetical protein
VTPSRDDLAMCDVSDAGAHDAPDRTGVLIIRAWLDDGAVFRARVTRVTDLHCGTPQMTVHATPSEVREAVQSWLRSFDTTAGRG